MKKKNLLITILAVILTTNVFSQALHFDGANDMVTISTTLGNFATSDFTFETWFKTTGTGDMAVVAKRPACTAGNFWNVRIISGRIWFEVQQNASTTISLGSPTTTLYNDGAWHHLAVVRRANVYNIFVNGLLVAQEVIASVLNLNNTAALNLGAGPCGSFTGTLDETRLWNIARNSYEILSDYNCEIAGAKPGLLFNYHYNQGIAGGTNTTVTTLIDDSGNNNNGTLTNFALTGAASNWVAPGAVSTAVACAAIASQSFQLNGNGGQDWSGGNCYTLTTNRTGLYGSIWYKQKIDLSQDFDMSANLNFGNNTNPGADGITFAFQNVCTSAGVGGGDIGIGGVSPSMVVEFDTYQNTGYSDPSYDHLAIFKNGVLNHSGANQLVAPVQIDPTNVNVTTGNDYLVRILWTASTHMLNVFVNGNLRSSYTGDIVAQIFGGSPYVYWGFTAATGGYSNQHKVCVVNLPANIVSLAATDTICQGSGYQANIPGYSTYSWSPTTGVSNPAIGNPVLSPATNTTYTLSVTDACGNVQTQSIDIVVNPLPEITASGATTICAGGQTQLNANGGTTYTWTPAITLSNAIISNPIATPASTTTYTVTGTTNACSDTATVTITTLPPPNITTSGNTAICEGGSTEITATQTNGIGYSWSPTSGLSATNVPNPTASPSSTTTYTVTSSNGICSGSESVTVTVLQPTTSNIQPIACSSYIAPDGAVYASSGTYQAIIPNTQGCDSTITINLTVNNPTSSVIAPIVCSSYTAPDGAIYTSNGTYQAVILNSQGCDSTITINLTVHPLPTVGAGNDFTVCEGEQITLSGSGATTYSWDNGVNDGVPFTEQGTMTYTVTGTDGNNCSNADQVTVMVNPLPTIDAGSDQVVCEGDAVTLSAIGGNSYNWNNGVTDATVFTPAHLGDLTYTVTGTDANNCSNTDQVVVTVNEHSSATQTQTALNFYTWPVNGQTYTQSGSYTTVIPNEAGCDSTITLDLSLEFTGLEDNSQGALFSVFPNPAQRVINVNTDTKLIGQVYSIYDNTGRVVLSGKLNAQNTSIELGNLSGGIYMFSVGENMKQTFKVIKE